MFSSSCESNILGSKTLADALEICFGRFGDSVAIDASGGKITYLELDGITRHVALELRSRFNDKQLKAKPIAILMSRSIEFYVAQIAVMRAGGFFLPIDPSQPAERIEFLLSDSSSLLMLVRQSDSLALEDSTVASFAIDVDHLVEERRLDPSSTAAEMAADDCGKIDENDFAYMIYLSLIHI